MAENTFKRKDAVLMSKSTEIRAYKQDIKLSIYEEYPGSWRVSLGNVDSMYLPTVAIPFVMDFALRIGEKLTNGQMSGYKLNEKEKEEEKFYINGLKKELDEAGYGYGNE